MAITLDSIVDKTSTAPANSEETSGVPKEILELPVFAGLLQGAPAGLWVETGSKAPEAVLAVKNGKKLNEIGLFFDRSKEEGVDIIFNAQYLSPQLVESAKKKGKLKEITSPLSEVSAQLNGAASPEAGGGALLAAGTPGPSGGLPETPINTQRLENLQPGSPTSGPLPGQGRVLSSLMKPTI